MATREKRKVDMVHIRLEPEVKRALEGVARRNGITLSALFMQAVLREARSQGVEPLKEAA